MARRQSPDDLSAGPAGQAKTTLYLPRLLHAAAKRAAFEAGLSVNTVIVQALERHLASAETAQGTRVLPENVNLGAEPAASSELLATMRALATRLARVEQVVERGLIVCAADPGRPLSVQQVRDVVRAILLERGAPMPHRVLLTDLLNERGMTLPGRDVSENLRTILVHPKSIGFQFLRGRGYWVDDMPVPDDP